MERAAGWPPLAVFHGGYVTTTILRESSAKFSWGEVSLR